MQTERVRDRRQHPARDHYQDVNNKIIAALEAGVVPWRKEWDATRCGGPFNPTTRRVYRGINRILLDLCRILHQNGDPRWCSYRQALARGWQVRRGETGGVLGKAIGSYRAEDGTTSRQESGGTGSDGA